MSSPRLYGVQPQRSRIEFGNDTAKFNSMANVVREPLQVYLTPDERAELDRAARALGVSRSEALRRGIRALDVSGYRGTLRDLAEGGFLTPAKTGPGEAPPSLPVAPLRALMEELASDRDT